MNFFRENFRRFATVIFTIFLLFFTVLAIFSWYQQIPSLGLDMDEVPYTLNGQFYEYRIRGEWSAFYLSADRKKLQFSDQEFQLVDQPQAGRYIFGFVLQQLGLSPWGVSWDPKFYNHFATGQLPKGELNQLHDYLGISLFKSILSLRYFSATLGLVAVIIFSFAIYCVTKRVFLSWIAFLWILNHFLFVTYLRLATTESLALLFLILGVITQFYTFVHFDKFTRNKKIGLSILSGVIAAIATSIKINGAFLLVLPFFFYTIHLLSEDVVGQKRNARSFSSEMKFLIFPYLFFFVGWASMFFFLEPELWRRPLPNLIILFQARLIQQAWFAQVEYLSPLETVINLVRQFSFQVSAFPVVGYVMLGMSGIGAYSLLQLSRKKYVARILVTTLVWALVCNLYYARVGFGRYFIPSTLVLVLLSAIGLSRTYFFLSSTKATLLVLIKTWI